jgi:hypothetical protein
MPSSPLLFQHINIPKARVLMDSNVWVLTARDRRANVFNMGAGKRIAQRWDNAGTFVLKVRCEEGNHWESK